MPSSSADACPPRAELAAQLDEEALLPALERHLDACPRCAAALRELARDEELAGVLRRAEVRTLAPAPAPEPPPAAPPEIPGLRLLRELGRGGQGVVYAAEQTATRREVAVKTLRPRSFSSPSQTLRFETEVQLAASLRHPNLVTVFDSGTTADGRHYLVMELVDGRPPREAVAGRSVRDVLQLFLKICDGITHAHQRGIIHRDLKPGNVLVDAELEPKVLDFGLAKHLDPAAEPITAGAHFLGSVFYAAPEQVSGRPEDVDVRTDVYALGHLLYELLTGEHPYPVEGSLSEVVRRITRVEPRDPREHVRQLDEDLAAIVLKALAKEKAERYQSANALGDDLRRYLAGEPVEAKLGQRWYVLRKTLRRYRVPVGLAGLVLLVVGTLSVLLADRTWRLERETVELARTLEDMHIEASRAHIAAGNAPAAEALLWREYLRSGSERSHWLLRELYARSPCLATWTASADEVRDLALDESGEVLLARSEDGLAVWRLDPLERLAELPPAARVRAAAFAPGGGRLLVGDADGGLQVLDLAGRTLDSVAGAHPGGTHALALAPAGDELFSGGRDGHVRRWRLDPLRAVGGWRAHDGGVHPVPHPDGRLLATSSADGRRVRVWALDGDGRPDPRPLAEATTNGGRPFWSADGSTLVTNGGLENEGFRFRWQADPPRLVPAGSVPGFWRRATLAGERVAQVGAAVGAVQLGRGMGSFVSEANLVSSSNPHNLAVDGRSELLAAAYPGGVVRLWEVGPPRSPRALVGHADTVHALRFDPTGARLATGAAPAGAEDASLLLWDVETGAPLAAVRAHAGVVSGVDFTPDGRRLASASHDGTIALWELPDLRPLAARAGHRGPVSGVRYLPAGGSDGPGRFLTAGSDRTLRRWHPETLRPERLEETGHAIRISSLDAAPDGSSLASGEGQGVATGAVRLSRGNVATWLADPERPLGSVRAIAYGPDGAWVAAGSDDRLVRIWSVADRRLVRRLAGHLDKVFALAAAPTEALLASADASGEIRVWSTRTWDCLTVLRSGTPATSPGERLVLALDFHPTRTLLASGGSRGEVLLWDLASFDRHIAGNREHQARLHALSR